MLMIYLAAINDDRQRKTFEYFYVTYRRQMFYVANSVLHNSEDAEDAVHNAFLGLAKNTDVLLNSEGDDARNYVLKSAKNAALNILRKNGQRNSEVSIEELTDVPDEKTFDNILEHTDYNDVLSAVKSLDPVYRDVLYMHYVMDMTVKQIAQTLDRKVSTVKQQLVRGKKQLIEILPEEVMTAYDK